MRPISVSRPTGGGRQTSVGDSGVSNVLTLFNFNYKETFVVLRVLYFINLFDSTLEYNMICMHAVQETEGFGPNVKLSTDVPITQK